MSIIHEETPIGELSVDEILRHIEARMRERNITRRLMGEGEWVISQVAGQMRNSSSTVLNLARHKCEYDTEDEQHRCVFCGYPGIV